MINTWMYDVFKEPKELEKIDKIVLDPTYITLGTGHPQGGNAMSKDPKHGVVDPDFRVHGYKNLYVCDASVFPGSLTVNPQQTVMSLAHYAASRIA
jgi:choline dehydrogenase-like flavoprotein